MDWREKLIKVKTTRRVGSDLKDLLIKKAAEGYLGKKSEKSELKKKKRNQGEI